MMWGEKGIDPLEIAANRMSRGEHVGERYVFGSGADLLIQRRMVDQQTMDRYRFGLLQQMADLYKHSMPEKAQEKYGPAVVSYIQRYQDYHDRSNKKGNAA